jgi:hypothetical protein
VTYHAEFLSSITNSKVDMVEAEEKKLNERNKAIKAQEKKDSEKKSEK